MPYLWIWLTPTYAGLYQANFPPLFRKLSNMLSSWTHLPLSWFGRIVAVCMSYIPELLYFFRVLPVPVPLHVLCIHQRKLLKFIWGPTRPRINKQVLYAGKINGGFSVPNLQAYYTAANKAPLSHLHETYQMPLWAIIDLVDQCRSLLCPGSLLYIAQLRSVHAWPFPFACGVRFNFLRA